MATRRSAGTGVAPMDSNASVNKRIASQNGDGFAELLVARRLAAAKSSLSRPASRQWNERVGVDKFDGGRQEVAAAENVAFENARPSQGKEWDGSAYRLQRRYTAWPCEWKTGARVCGISRSRAASTKRASSRKRPEVSLRRKTRARETARALHDSPHVQDQTVRRQACRRLFEQDFTRPSASFQLFWHSRERATPSSKSFMASSRESCGSQAADDFLHRARERSKIRLLGASGFLLQVNSRDWPVSSGVDYF